VRVSESAGTGYWVDDQSPSGETWPYPMLPSYFYLGSKIGSRNRLTTSSDVVVLPLDRHGSAWMDRRVARPGDIGLSRRRICLPVLKAGTAFSDTATRSPVFGLRPVRAPRFFTANVPKPRSSTRSPCARASPMVPRIAFTIFSMSREYKCGFCSASFWTSSDLIIGGVGLCSGVIFRNAARAIPGGQGMGTFWRV
jgi:hypothetical protein